MIYGFTTGTSCRNLSLIFVSSPALVYCFLGVLLPFHLFSLTSPSHYRSSTITSNSELAACTCILASQKSETTPISSTYRKTSYNSTRVRTYEQKIEIASNAFFHSLPSLARLLFLLEASGCGSIITKLALPDDTCMLESLFTVPIHGSACRHYWDMDRWLSELYMDRDLSIGWQSSIHVWSNRPAMHLRVNRISPRMIHYIETHHMSQLQDSKLSAGKNSVDICFSCSGSSLVTCCRWSPECSFFFS